MHLGNSFFETILTQLRAAVLLLSPWPGSKKVMLCSSSSFSVLLQFAQFMWMVDVGASGKWSCIPISRCRLVFTCLNIILKLNVCVCSFWRNWSMFEDIPLYFLIWCWRQIEVYASMDVPNVPETCAADYLNFRHGMERSVKKVTWLTWFLMAVVLIPVCYSCSKSVCVLKTCMIRHQLLKNLLFWHNVLLPDAVV